MGESGLSLIPLLIPQWVSVVSSPSPSMAATAPRATSSAVACKAESKDQGSLSDFLSILHQEEIFSRSLRILPLTFHRPRVDHIVPLTLNMVQSSGITLKGFHNLRRLLPRGAVSLP